MYLNWINTQIMGSLSAEFIKDKQLVIETYSGGISVEEYIDLKSAEFLHESYVDDINILSDIRFSAYQKYEDDLLLLQKFIDLHAERLTRNRLALLISSTKQLFDFQGLAMLKNILPNYSFNVFTNRQDALDWLENTNIG